MATFDFIYEPNPGYPGSSFLDIYLETYSRLKDGKITVIPTCHSKWDVDNGIDSLIQQLEEVRKKAKAKLKR